MRSLKAIAQHRLFQRAPDCSSNRQIIRWWELRRIVFNLVVGATGIFTTACMVALAIFSERHLGEPIGLPDPPILAVFGIIVYGVAANVCYTGGWFVELTFKPVWKESSSHFGRLAFAAGLGFSILLTLLPLALCVVVVLLELVGIIPPNAPVDFPQSH